MRLRAGGWDGAGNLSEDAASEEPASGEDPHEFEELSDVEMASIQVREENPEELWVPQLLFDAPRQDRFRAGVAAEFTRLSNDWKESNGGRALPSGVYDQLNEQAWTHAAAESNEGGGGGGRPARAASRVARGVGGGFYA